MGVNLGGAVIEGVGTRVAVNTKTFTGASGLGQAATNTTWFTITGQVLVAAIVPFCTTLLTEAAPTATITLGVTGSTALFIAATNAVDIDADEFWVDTTPDAAGVAIPAALKDVVINANIISAVATQNITAGVIQVTVFWLPVSSDGALVPA